MSNKHAVPNTSKRLKQFSTRSRSKSAASFKGLNKLRRVLSHDGSYDTEDSSRERPVSMKKSKSSDSLSRIRGISGLNMTALAKVASNPAHLTHDNASASSIHGGLKPHRGNSTKSILELRDGDEIFEDHSTTDEEVEYFTDEDHKAQDGGLENSISGDHKRDVRAAQEESTENFDNPHQLPPHEHDNQDSDDQDLASKDSGEDQTLMDSDRDVSPQSTRDEVVDGNSRTDSNKTLRNQPIYGVPSSIRNSSADRLDTIDHIEAGGDSTPGSTNVRRLISGLVNVNRIEDSDRIGHRNPDEDIINAGSNIQTMANSLRRHGPTPSRTGDLGHDGDDDDDDDDDASIPASNHNQRGNKENTTYSPTMILSQSTGIEKRFDGSSTVADETVPHLLNNESDRISGGDQTQSNNFNYINSDFAASYNSTHVTERPNSSLVKPDFSTSISSLSSHLSRPTQLTTEVRSNNFLNQRAPQLSATNHNTNRPHVDSRLSNSNRPDSLSNFNNFSQFLQTENSGMESRTQQKLWLQRENSIMDLSSHSSSPDSIFLASNIEVKREFERISREYTNVRRFNNPVTASLNRNGPRSKIEMKKLRPTISSGEEMSKVFRSDNPQDRKTFQEFCKQNLNRNIDIQKVLTKIWTEESAEFNKGSELLAENEPENTSLTYGNHRSQNRHSLRNSSANTVNHQRTLGSLQPTTRAVHRRMESALSQQQRP
ncbi:LANO_0F01156g1_1 [Lachancea nothofagi CBS 11611]|uniref:LANO_0F01156g1_1 n=1 Tax=Lachancea nothofagi CBS 11611 TaxID=1266666 RepID=A0A1G4K5V3_9SACH|nr:LANO_0F01156g1_1 [Lachancea nothofagi CBS 11611]